MPLPRSGGWRAGRKATDFGTPCGGMTKSATQRAVMPGVRDGCHVLRRSLRVLRPGSLVDVVGEPRLSLARPQDEGIAVATSRTRTQPGAILGRRDGTETSGMEH